MSQTTLRSQLEKLECHFTWLQQSDHSRNKLLRLQDNLEDIGTEGGCQWLGQIYNLQAYIHYQLSSQGGTLGSTTKDALRCLSKAAEAFHQIKNTVSDEGPWLLVNYSNMAWMHFYLKEQAKSQEYVAKVQALLQEYPYPSPDELHAEVYAEKAWTLMHFGPERGQEAIEYFQKAVSMEPDRVEWLTSQALAIASASKDYCTSSQEQKDELIEKLKTAKERDPENVYVAAVYLGILANTGKVIEGKARELAQRVLQKPVSSYSGIRPLLTLYGMHLSLDEAIDLAKEALKRNPQGPNNNRYLKFCLATCYKRKIYSDMDNDVKQRRIDQAIGLFKEVISLYPNSSFTPTLFLAGVYKESTQYKAEAGMLYENLERNDNLEPKQLQQLYNCKAKFLHYENNLHDLSVEYHMKAAEIPTPSYFRHDSIKILTYKRDNASCPKIKDFLAKLHKEPETLPMGSRGVRDVAALRTQELEDVENESCFRPDWQKKIKKNPAPMPATPKKM